jgi:hypothetical protein
MAFSMWEDPSYNRGAGNPSGFAPYKSDRDDGRRALRPQHDEVAFRPTQLALQVGGGHGDGTALTERGYSDVRPHCFAGEEGLQKHAFLRNEPDWFWHENMG